MLPCVPAKLTFLFLLLDLVGLPPSMEILSTDGGDTDVQLGDTPSSDSELEYNNNIIQRNHRYYTKIREVTLPMFICIIDIRVHGGYDFAIAKLIPSILQALWMVILNLWQDIIVTQIVCTVKSVATQTEAVELWTCTGTYIENMKTWPHPQ